MANNQIGWDSDTKMLNSINKQLDKLITTVYSSSTSAAQSALEAEAAATLSTEQATLSASARNDAEAARLGAENAEDNALISEINAATSANNALVSEQASEAARDEIVDKIDFTGAVEGDLLEQNSTGMYVPKSAKLINQSLTPFLNSPLAGFIDLDNLFAWDSFNRPNIASTLTSDSGNNYIQFSGSSGLRIENNYAYKNNASDIIGVNTGFGSVRFINNVRIRPGNSYNSVVIGKDANNYIIYQFDPAFVEGIRVSIVIGGVATLLSAQNFYAVFGLSSGLLIGSSAIVTLIIDLIRPSEGGMVLRINCPTVPNLNQYVDLSSYRDSDYPNASDIAYVGWGFGNNRDSTRISSWSVFNIIS